MRPNEPFLLTEGNIEEVVAVLNFLFSNGGTVSEGGNSVPFELQRLKEEIWPFAELTSNIVRIIIAVDSHTSPGVTSYWRYEFVLGTLIGGDETHLVFSHQSFHNGPVTFHTRKERGAA